jgi:hypothetical protein
MNSIIITRNGATLFINMKPYTVGSDHPRYDDIINAARSGEWHTISPMVDIINTIKESIVKTDNPHLTIKNNSIIYKHITFPDDLSQYVINMIRDKFDLTPMINFMENLLKNPDHRVFQQLFGFMSYGKNPITPDGKFLAYKKVRSDYTSVHDGLTKHVIGEFVSMDRDACNSNPEQTCSTGLHFCSQEYLSNFSGENVLVLEIDPADVVSIPVDYNNTKGRACKYKVVGELDQNDKVKVLKTDTLKTATVETKYEKSDAADIALYLEGYDDGKKKLQQRIQEVNYLAGYKDGKGKKKKRYTLEESSDKTEEVYSDEELYLMGYNDGKCRNEIKIPASPVYVSGYKDGRGKKKKQY